MSSSEKDFIYLNSGGQWLGFARQGLAIGKDGSLNLARLPGSAIPVPLQPQGNAPGPAGIALGPCGLIYRTLPRLRQIICESLEGKCPPRCSPCGPSDELRCPRGLLYHAGRKALFVVDSASASVRLIDPESFETLEVWNSKTPGDRPAWRMPLQIAQASSGDVFVLDYRARRIDQFDMRGRWVPSFWDTLRQQALIPKRPAMIASAADSEGNTLLYVVDARHRQLYVLDATGHLRMRASIPDTQNTGAGLRCDALAVDADNIYLSDRAANRLLIFSRDFEDAQPLTSLGVAMRLDGAPMAVVRGKHKLLVSSGDARPIVDLGFDIYAKSGWLVAGPFANPDPERQAKWHRIKCEATLGPTSHVQLYTAFVCPGHGVPPGPPFQKSDWTPLTPDATHSFFQGESGKSLCLAVEICGDGQSTASISNILLEFSVAQQTQHLPPVLLQDPSGDAVLRRLVALLCSGLEDVEGEYDGLPRQLDFGAADPAWLPWLAAWIAAELPSGTTAQIRQALGSAYADSVWRGTSQWIARQVAKQAGVTVRIDEPILRAAPWVLPRQSCPEHLQPGLEPPRLGITTTLAAAPPQAASVGSATVDSSALIDESDYGLPVYEQLAHRILIGVYRGATFNDQTPAQVQSIVDAQRPAHVDASVYVIEPRLTVGFQSRIGIDAIVAPPLRTLHPHSAAIRTRDFTFADGDVWRIGDGTSPVPRLTADN